MALGGDGCPFGKHENACSFLVNFINIGHRVASSEENFLVFGGNCDEGHPLIKRYVQMIMKQMSDLDGKQIVHGGTNMTFKFQEFPNDMKMICMLAGEILNAATYFTTFANVSKENCGDIKGTFGNKPSDKWRPFTYEERRAAAQKVAHFKKQFSNSTLSQSTIRSKITTFISSIKSRQEFPPPLGRFVDKVHIEPLHIKNNAWQQWQKGCLS